MADTATIKRFIPQSDVDAQKAATTFTGKLSIPDYARGVPYIPLGEKPVYLSKEELERRAALAKAVSEKSAARNEATGKKKKEINETVVKELRRLKEESRIFTYTNPYFAGPQAGVFIGDRWVSNIVTIEYTESSTDAPVYGYASRHFDAVMQGNVLVQGNFTIAFTDGNYLGRFLSNYHRTEGQNDGTSSSATDEITRAKDYWWGAAKRTEDDVEAAVPMNFRQTFGLSGYVGRGFDIRLFFGAREFLETSPRSGSDEPEGPIEVIKDVHVTGRAMLVAPTGDPIGESWTFFARGVQTLRDRSESPMITSVRSFSLRQDTNVPTVSPDGTLRNLGSTVRLGFPT
jgi:hypothetical protein